ncbi:hypothetical protein [Dyella sp. 2HG41-7]|uniref:hypothetical protein n=1 Tax=Dyella sp. 2HG41-7 TaxID=2883239 RepID=UPI001F362409|nr:hypothetical protein [Dyella sp. 2HG41-7]
MHMLLARSALVRGMQLVAGMLSVSIKQDAVKESNTLSELKLVSWTSSARSRREDEMARIQQMQAKS